GAAQATGGQGLEVGGGVGTDDDPAGLQEISDAVGLTRFGDEVDDGGDAFGVGVPHLVDGGSLGEVDELVGSQFAQVVGGGGVGGGHDVRAGGGGQLHDRLPDAAGGAVDQDGRTGGQFGCGDEIVGGGSGGGQCGGDVEGEFLR